VARAGGSEDKQVQAMADRLVEFARQCMKDRNKVSPFESAYFFPKLFASFPFFYPSCFHYLGFLPLSIYFLADVFFSQGSH
jgi:hypothetical protein